MFCGLRSDPLLALTPGPGYWLHVVYAYLCLLAGAMILFSVWLRSSQLYRRQTGIMLLGASVPFASNLLYLAGIRPFGHLDLTPFAFSATGVAVAFGLFRYGLFDLMPLAHGVLLKNLREGIVVLDGGHRVMEMNPAARRIIGTNGRPLVGSWASRVFAGHPALLDLIRDGREAEQEWVEKEKLQALVETAGAVCHEMNQPLMAVSGFDDFFTKPVSLDTLREAVEDAFEKLERWGVAGYELV